MKKIYLLLCILPILTINPVQSQEILTVAEIYDFSINDEFHSSDIFPDQTPNAIRMKVIDKHFSATNDTVFYTRSFNNYYSVFIPNPEPHLDYFYDIYIDTVFYTNFSDSVVCHVLDTTCVSIFETTICDIPANGWAEGGYLSGQFHSKIFGKGLGRVTDNYWAEDSENSHDIEMFYFKKDTMECGTPDLTTSIPSNRISLELDNFYPNPVRDFINISSSTNSISEISFHTQTGQKILSIKSPSNNIDISNLPPGLYFAEIKTSEGDVMRKIVVQ